MYRSGERESGVNTVYLKERSMTKLIRTEWISVNKEKPKDQEAVFVFDKWDDKFYVRVAFYNESRDEFCDPYDEGHSIDDVTYWTHLLEAPKEDI